MSNNLPTTPGQCSRRGCSHRSLYNEHDGVTKYCVKHHRFRSMRKNAQERKLKAPSFEDMEHMLKEVQDMICPTCGTGMQWACLSGEPRGSVISLQHWDSGEMSFICNRCNSRHGKSKLRDRLFDVKLSEKYCPTCEEVKSKSGFYKDASSPDGIGKTCKICHKERDKKRYKKWRAA